MVHTIFCYIIELIKGYIISLTESFEYVHYIAWQIFFHQLERGQLFKNLDRVELIVKRLVQKLFSRYPSPLLVDFLNFNFFSDSFGFLGEWPIMPSNVCNGMSTYLWKALVPNISAISSGVLLL